MPHVIVTVNEDGSAYQTTIPEVVTKVLRTGGFGHRDLSESIGPMKEIDYLSGCDVKPSYAVPSAGRGGVNQYSTTGYNRGNVTVTSFSGVTVSGVPATWQVNQAWCANIKASARRTRLSTKRWTTIWDAVHA